MKTVIGLALLLAGCSSDADAPETGTASKDVTGVNGMSLNGMSLNGMSLNGMSLNGMSLNGMSLNGMSLNGMSLNGMSLNGMSLNGMSLNGMSLNGADFIGATGSGILSNGQSIPLRIDDIDALDGPNSDVLAYEVSIGVDGAWTSLCGYETDGSARRALAVEGTWDSVTGAWSNATTAFSFACRQASIAKCVELGYKSWLGYSDHHHACVRMLRADYCGTGTPYTVNGTPINLYDSAGVQTDTESWPVDAEWGPEGALCFKNHRGGVQPACYAQKYSATCGSFANGALLVDEYNGQ